MTLTMNNGNELESLTSANLRDCTLSKMRTDSDIDVLGKTSGRGHLFETGSHRFLTFTGSFEAGTAMYRCSLQ